jgi:leucyl/phenylalanyl-tRNA--protein transferase
LNNQPLLRYLQKDAPFPAIETAWKEPNGLLAMGADLSASRLIEAYANGIFPWYSDGDPILWWSPDPRAIMMVGEFKPSKSLIKYHRKLESLKVTRNIAFDSVIESCATVPRQDQGTWITSNMIDAYKALHRAGAAHSIEVWRNDELIGGLYGVGVGKVFCGESMFHHLSNASKIAFWYLNQHLASYKYRIIDCQMLNPHLASLGVYETSRANFSKTIQSLTRDSIDPTCWKPGDIVCVNKDDAL